MIRYRPTSWVPFWIALATNALITMTYFSHGVTYLSVSPISGSFGDPLNLPEPPPPPPMLAQLRHTLPMFGAQALIQLGFALIMIPNRWVIALAVVVLLPTLFYWLISFQFYFFPTMLAVAYAFGKRSNPQTIPSA